MYVSVIFFHFLLFTPIYTRRYTHIPSLTYTHAHHHHHYHIALVARISLTLSRHSSLSFIALGRYSGQHPVSSHSCWMYVRAGRPAFAQPCVVVQKSTCLMSSSLLLQQCPACLVRLTWITTCTYILLTKRIQIYIHGNKYIFTHIRIHTHTHTHVLTHTCTQTYIHTTTHMHTYTCTHEFTHKTRIFISTYNTHSQTCIYIVIQTCTRIHIHTYTHTCILTYIHLQMFTHTCILEVTHTYTHIHINTHIHAYPHTYTYTDTYAYRYTQTYSYTCKHIPSNLKWSRRKGSERRKSLQIEWNRL